MTLRKITSLTMLISFILCVLTSVILYIVPHGRVAYWSDWRLWGLSKTQWSELHLNLGILLILAGILHLYYNWNPLIAYLKSKAKTLTVFNVNFNIALLLTLVIGLGTYFQVPPMSTIISIGASIKDAAGIKYGEPPYGHAELSSLKMFTKKVDLDLDQSIALLRQANIDFDNEKQTILAIATANNLTPKELFAVIKPATKNKGGKDHPALPDSPPPGFGRKKLADICTDFNLDLATITTALSQAGIEADPNQSVKEIASQNDMEPMAIFEIIRDAANAS